jgi:glycosyltransferase involved in cell wall biosynthesis
MTRDPTVSFVTTNIDGDGGVSQYTKDLTTELENQGCDVAVSSLPDRGLLKLVGWTMIIREMAKRRPEVVHLQYAFTEFGLVGPIFLAMLSLYCDCLVVTFHERVDAKVWYVERALSVPSVAGPLLAGLLWLYDWMLVVFADVSIVHTEQHAQELCRLPMASVEIIPHYIKQPQTNTDAERIGKIRLSRVVNAAGPILTTFGRVTPKKGHEEVIRVLPRIKGAIYMIAGAAPSAHESYEQKLRRIAHDAGVEDRVLFTGFVESEQISTLFSVTDIAILPYRQVTESGALYDAIGSGCPVVTTALPAFDVVDSWDVGKRFPEGQADQLIQCVEMVLNDRETFAQRTEFLASENSLRNVAQRHLELYTHTREITPNCV